MKKLLEKAELHIFFRKLLKSQLVPDIRPGSVFCLPLLTNNDNKIDGQTDEYVLNDIEAGIYLSIHVC